jgi:hypothetical protein
VAETIPPPSRDWPSVLPARQVRIARPTDRLDEVVRFYHEGLGLDELSRFADDDAYTGVMLGLAGATYRLEFTTHDHGNPGRSTPDIHRRAASPRRG